MSETQRERQTEDEQTQEKPGSKTESGSCTECGGTLRPHESRGEITCEDCGLVAKQDTIDRGPEWRAFDSKEKNAKSRVGSPTTKLMHDKGLSTEIDWKDKDAYGNTLSSRQRKKMQRLRTWNERFQTEDSQDRNLRQALGEIDRMSSALGIDTKTRETASVLYRRCLEEDMLPGRSIESMATASLYAACRQTANPRSIDSFFPVTRARSNMHVKRAYKYISKELGLKIKPIDPKDLLNKYLSQLDKEVSDRQLLQRMSNTLLDIAQERNLHSGRSPTALAAGAIYGASQIIDEGLTQKEVGEASNTSTVTIRNRYQEMLQAYGDTTEAQQ